MEPWKKFEKLKEFINQDYVKFQNHGFENMDFKYNIYLRAPFYINTDMDGNVHVSAPHLLWDRFYSLAVTNNISKSKQFHAELGFAIKEAEKMERKLSQLGFIVHEMP